MSEQQWYMAKNGHQIGPMSEAELVDNIHNGSADGTTLVFTAGMSTWTAVAEIPQLATPGTDARHPPAPPLPPGRTAHEIDFTIEGTEMQYVEVELDPGESAVAEAGAMMYMTGDIEMETVFGDGGAKQQSGVMDKLMGAGKRLLTGESLFMTCLQQYRLWQAAGGVRRALRGQDPRDGSLTAAGRAHLSERRLPVRGEGGLDRYRIPEKDRRGTLRWRRVHHATPRGRRPRLPARGRHGPSRRFESWRDTTR